MGTVDELNVLALKILTTINNMTGTVARMHNQNPANTKLEQPLAELVTAQDEIRNSLFGKNANLKMNAEQSNNTINNGLRR